MNLMEMSLEDKILEQFTNFEIVEPNPSQDHPWHLSHLHADFLELRTLLWDRNSYLAFQDALTFYKDYDISIDIEPEPSLDGEIAGNVPQRNDKWNSRFKAVFDVLEERDLIYEDVYPFELGHFKLKLKENLNSKQKLYLYLLIASNLNNFKKLKPDLTSEFESLSAEVLKCYVNNLTVEEFGENSTYRGNTITKIKQLATKLNISIRREELKKIPRRALKEKGLDIVGWNPFADQIASMVIILAQCGCGKDWVKKMDDSARYEKSYLDFYKMAPIHAMFIPYGLVHYDTTFYQSDVTNGSLIFERKRIIDLLSNDLTFFESLGSFTIVNRCIEETIVEV